MKRSFGMKNFAFTLVEVLITLTIIGVVAALTLPNIMKNIERKDLETAFKKSYSVISQAITQMKADEGASIYLKFQTSPYNSSAEIKNLMLPYFNVINNCAPESNCPPAAASSYKNYTNKASFMNGSNFVNKFYTVDGMLVSPVYGGAIIFFWVDINGWNKGPNRGGYDLFCFQLMPNDNLLPVGTKNTYTNGGYCNNSTTSFNGLGCAFRAVNEKDYFKNLP